MERPPPDPDPNVRTETLACGREAGHEGAHSYYFTGFLARQDSRLVFG